jgi:WD40 repeat protein
VIVSFPRVSNANYGRNCKRDISSAPCSSHHAGAPPSPRGVFAPDGGRILTAGGRFLTDSADNTARLWDRDVKPLATLRGHIDWVLSAVFAPDGGRILTASHDKTARLWDRDGKLLATLQGHTGPVLSGYSPPTAAAS